MTNQCVSCGAEMPEGDQVCRECKKADYKKIMFLPDPEDLLVDRCGSSLIFESKHSRPILNWRGEVFEVPSTDWLREAIQEKREREARHVGDER